MYKEKQVQIGKAYDKGTSVHDPDYEDWMEPEEIEKIKALPSVAYLPHSCDQWVIGDVEQVKLLIKDLQDILVILESNNV